jgi:spermidine/putrescine transport system ATP-binding protein
MAEVALRSLGEDLRLDSVSRAFGEIKAVDDVSLEVSPGEFFSLLGPSGCGKTTTLRLIAGFEVPDSGRISLSGADITRQPANRRRVNTVFQHYALFPHMTVENNVAYGLKYESLGKEEKRVRLERGLSTVRLQDLRTRFPRELSGGQQQRVALARALVKEPTVLLLDEPLAALDLKLRKAMQTELKRLQERVSITFVYVTHDQEEALTLSDRVAVMNAGRVLQVGTPSEVYERPASRFVADFIGDTNFFEGTVEATEPPIVVRTKRGFILHCIATARVESGMPVVVAVRPEQIAIDSLDADSREDNVIDGVISRRTYLGDLIQYHVQIAGDLEVRVQQQNRFQQDTVEAGERVRLQWSRNASLAMSDEAGPVADEEARQLVEVKGLGA